MLPIWESSETNYNTEMDISGFPDQSQWYLDKPNSMLLEHGIPDAPPECFDGGIPSSQHMFEGIMTFPDPLCDDQGNNMLILMPAHGIDASRNNTGAVGTQNVQYSGGEDWVSTTPNGCIHVTEAAKITIQPTAWLRPEEQLRTQQVTVASSPVRALKEPTPEDWHQLRPIIWALNKKHTIAVIKNILRDQHGFRTRQVQLRL